MRRADDDGKVAGGAWSEIHGAERPRPRDVRRDPARRDRGAQGRASTTTRTKDTARGASSLRPRQTTRARACFATVFSGDELRGGPRSRLRSAEERARHGHVARSLRLSSGISCSTSRSVCTQPSTTRRLLAGGALVVHASCMSRPSACALGRLSMHMGSALSALTCVAHAPSNLRTPRSRTHGGERPISRGPCFRRLVQVALTSHRACRRSSPSRLAARTDPRSQCFRRSRSCQRRSGREGEPYGWQLHAARLVQLMAALFKSRRRPRARTSALPHGRTSPCPDAQGRAPRFARHLHQCFATRRRFGTAERAEGAAHVSPSWHVPTRRRAKATGLGGLHRCGCRGDPDRATAARSAGASPRARSTSPSPALARTETGFAGRARRAAPAFRPASA